MRKPQLGTIAILQRSDPQAAPALVGHSVEVTDDRNAAKLTVDRHAGQRAEAAPRHLRHELGGIAHLDVGERGARLSLGQRAGQRRTLAPLQQLLMLRGDQRIDLQSVAIQSFQREWFIFFHGRGRVGETHPEALLQQPPRRMPDKRAQIRDGDDRRAGFTAAGPRHRSWNNCRAFRLGRRLRNAWHRARRRQPSFVIGEPAAHRRRGIVVTGGKVAGRKRLQAVARRQRRDDRARVVAGRPIVGVHIIEQRTDQHRRIARRLVAVAPADVAHV